MQTCMTGRVVKLPSSTRRQSGATHVLQDHRGRDVALLRARGDMLEHATGQTVRVCGYRRGKVAGEGLPLLEVAGGILLKDLPLRPGLDPFSGPAELKSDGLPIKPLVGI